MDYHAHTVRDNLSFFSDVAAVREPTVAAISAVQDHAPHVQLLALAGAVTVLCEGININPHDLLQRVENMKADAESPFAQQWQAMREYAKGEFR